MAQWDERLCVWCRRMERNDPYVGSYLRAEFPYADVESIDRIKANVHPNCRCVLIRQLDDAVLDTRIDPLTKKLETLQRIPIDQIEFREPYVGKPGEDPYHYRVGQYAEKPAATAPPILVFGKRFENDTYQVIDGHHRVLAAKQRGDRYILAWVFPS